MLIEVEIYNEQGGDSDKGFINPNNVETAYAFKLRPTIGEASKSRDCLKLIMTSGKEVCLLMSIDDYNLACSSMMTQTGAILEQGRQHYHAQASRIINPNGVL